MQYSKLQFSLHMCFKMSVHDKNRCKIDENQRKITETPIKTKEQPMKNQRRFCQHSKLRLRLSHESLPLFFGVFQLECGKR